VHRLEEKHFEWRRRRGKHRIEEEHLESRRRALTVVEKKRRA